MLRFGNGRVSPHGLQSEIVLALLMVEPIFQAEGHDCIITSLTDGLHGPTTLHPKGLAVDLRSHHLPVAGKGALLAAMREALPPYYEVYLESIWSLSGVYLESIWRTRARPTSTFTSSTTTRDDARGGG